MSVIFADTFYWIAFSNVQDRAHEQVKAFMLAAPSAILYTTEEVLTAYLNYFAAWGPRLRHKAASNVHSMMESRVVEIAPQTTDSFVAGLDLYRARLDKGYSLTDCISMQVMRQRGITEALTNDRHFEQEGFRALVRAITVSRTSESSLSVSSSMHGWQVRSTIPIAKTEKDGHTII
jgi:predicted nucleic acid-binding protein